MLSPTAGLLESLQHPEYSGARRWLLLLCGTGVVGNVIARDEVPTRVKAWLAYLCTATAAISFAPLDLLTALQDMLAMRGSVPSTSAMAYFAAGMTCQGVLSSEWEVRTKLEVLWGGMLTAALIFADQQLVQRVLTDLSRPRNMSVACALLVLPWETVHRVGASASRTVTRVCGWRGWVALGCMALSLASHFVGPQSQGRLSPSQRGDQGRDIPVPSGTSSSAGSAPRAVPNLAPAVNLSALTLPSRKTKGSARGEETERAEPNGSRTSSCPPGLSTSNLIQNSSFTTRLEPSPRERSASTVSSNSYVSWGGGRVPPPYMPPQEEAVPTATSMDNLPVPTDHNLSPLVSNSPPLVPQRSPQDTGSPLALSYVSSGMTLMPHPEQGDEVAVTPKPVCHHFNVTSVSTPLHTPSSSSPVPFEGGGVLATPTVPRTGPTARIPFQLPLNRIRHPPLMTAASRSQERSSRHSSPPMCPHAPLILPTQTPPVPSMSPLPPEGQTPPVVPHTPDLVDADMLVVLSGSEAHLTFGGLHSLLNAVSPVIPEESSVTANPGIHSPDEEDSRFTGPG